jgi:hypothetical protein
MKRILFLLIIAVSAHAQTWPLEPTGSDHPIGNTFGEYQGFGLNFQHAGIDILAVPKLNADATENPAAPWVRTTVAGTPTSLDNDPGNYNFTYVTTAAGRDYLYGHLQQDSYHASFVTAFMNGTAVTANAQVSKVARWTLCDYHHHHYEIHDGTTLISPYFDISPDPDGFAPVVESVNFATNNSNPWSVKNAVAAGGCTVVDGLVDIIAEVRDRDDAGSVLPGAESNWPRNLRWRACPDSSPDCAWQSTHLYDDMPFAWWDSASAVATTVFSTRTPWISSSDYCGPGAQYGIVTNFGAGGSADASGAWNTTLLVNGPYSVSIEATDFSGNLTRRSVRACVQNGGACTTEVMIRDGADDSGGIPYGGPNWWVSPDITANPGTPEEDVNINLGLANPINVTPRNSGSCAIPAGTPYTVCLGWYLPTGSVPHPLPAANVIGCQALTVPAGGWAVGSAITTTFTWTPDPLAVPDGHHCLVAWIDLTADPVMNTPAVNWDDNRAQQNIQFVDVGPGAPQGGSFWMNPQEMIGDRGIELVFHDFDPGARFNVVLPPQLEIRNVTGAKAVRSTECGGQFSENQNFQRCYVTLQDLSAGARVMIDVSRVFAAGKIDVMNESGAKGTVDIIEHGIVRGLKERGPVGGATIRFEKR